MNTLTKQEIYIARADYAKWTQVRVPDMGANPSVEFNNFENQEKRVIFLILDTHMRILHL